MDNKSIHQNESIQDGLEKFLDEEMLGIDSGALSEEQVRTSRGVSNQSATHTPSAQTELKTEFATPYVHNKPEMRKTSDATVRKHPDRMQSAGQGRTVSEKARPVRGDRQEEKTKIRENVSSYREYEKTMYGGIYRSDTAHRDVRMSDSGKRSAKSSDINSRDQKNGDRSGRNSRDEREKNMTGKSSKKANGSGGSSKKARRARKKKPAGKVKKVLIILLIVLIALALWWYFMVGKIYNKMQYEKADDLTSGSLKEDGVMNILLIGNDSRENGEDGRSDAMILVSVSPKTKTITMTSLLRDMYVEIPGYGGNRLNAAYAYGGPSLLCETIEQNFGIEVNRYALVNFQAFAGMVDAVGGVDLELTNEEVQWVNAYLNEYNLLEGREITTDYLDTSLSGMIHLNGPQALAYCRNRYIGTDFGRTERQRKVLGAVTKKLPLALATNSSELIDGLFPYLTTNLTQMEVYSVSLKAPRYLGYEMKQLVIPAEGTYSNATIRKMMVLQVDFEANQKLLRQEIYGEGNSVQSQNGAAEKEQAE